MFLISNHLLRILIYNNLRILLKQCHLDHNHHVLLKASFIQKTLCFEFIVVRYGKDFSCKTRENSNFLKNGKMVILVKIQNFSRSRMMKRTSPLESSREI